MPSFSSSRFNHAWGLLINQRRPLGYAIAVSLILHIGLLAFVRPLWRSPKDMGENQPKPPLEIHELTISRLAHNGERIAIRSKLNPSPAHTSDVKPIAIVLPYPKQLSRKTSQRGSMPPKAPSRSAAVQVPAEPSPAPTPNVLALNRRIDEELRSAPASPEHINIAVVSSLSSVVQRAKDDDAPRVRRLLRIGRLALCSEDQTSLHSLTDSGSGDQFPSIRPTPQTVPLSVTFCKANAVPSPRPTLSP